MGEHLDHILSDLALAARPESAIDVAESLRAHSTRA